MIVFFSSFFDAAQLFPLDDCFFYTLYIHDYRYRVIIQVAADSADERGSSIPGVVQLQRSCEDRNLQSCCIRSVDERGSSIPGVGGYNRNIYS